MLKPGGATVNSEHLWWIQKHVAPLTLNISDQITFECNMILNHNNSFTSSDVIAMLKKKSGEISMLSV